MQSGRIRPRLLPERIADLRDVAQNLWWTWHPQAQQLFITMDAGLWESVYHNPIDFLSKIDNDKLSAAAKDSAFLAAYDAVLAAFYAYMQATDTWFDRTHPDQTGSTIAYFSPEFGLHESLPIYSGGLGILSGDHCKEASDLDLPLVGVGFLYPQGYFLQRINADGVQEALYPRLNFSDVPASPARTPDGRPAMVRVELPGRTVYAIIWHLQVGRVPVYLMDTDVEANAPADRDLSARLYGGDQEMRISQEIMLGIGGVRALRALGIAPDIWHMNEGHSAFLVLERLRELVRAGLAPHDAQERVRRSTIFTTHTPVPAGNDAFTYDLMDKHFWQQWIEFGMSRDEFLNLGRQDVWGSPHFAMTVLALRMSAFHNGVSKIHGGVARSIWHFVYPDVPVDKVPITSITNGVHTDTWLAPPMGQLYDRYLGPTWRKTLDEPATWAPVATIPDETLWQTKQALKQRLIEAARQRMRQRRQRIGEPAEMVAQVDTTLNPEALTIGFARRFATYKRATLILHDMERIKRIMKNAQQPVQLLVAGKAHPNDEPGKQLIHDIYQFSRQADLEGHIVILEEYDMYIARLLVQGVDVWLNTPRKPNEASGTSGQKASLNGAPNLSILDGWWAEAYNGKNGWAIDGGAAASPEAQDDQDSRALYDLLENQVVPLYYRRGDDHLPHDWLAVCKEAIRTVAPTFSTRRMVKEYTNQLYIAAETEAQTK